MAWPDPEVKVFPRPRPKEPAHLRQDILDEIADHLALAAEAERDRCGDESEVWRRILGRFGDPNALARQLWWDAMKEGIMREWIKTGVVVVVGVAMVAFMWVVLRQMQQSNQEVLLALRERGEDPTAMSVTLDVVVHRGTEDGPPAEGIKVSFSGKGPGDEDLSIQDTTAADGRLHFGPLQQGKYLLSFYDTASGLGHKRTETLWAGHGADELHIVAPDVGKAEVSLTAEFPPLWDDNHQLLLVRSRSVWEHGGFEWKADHNQLLLGEQVFTDVSEPPRPKPGSRPAPRGLPEDRKAFLGRRASTAGQGVATGTPAVISAAAAEFQITSVTPVFDWLEKGEFRPCELNSGAHVPYIPWNTEPTRQAFHVSPDGPNRFDLQLPEDMREMLAFEARAWHNAKVLDDYGRTAFPTTLAETEGRVVAEARPMEGWMAFVVPEDTLGEVATPGDEAYQLAIRNARKENVLCFLADVSGLDVPEDGQLMLAVPGVVRQVIDMAEGSTMVRAHALRSPWNDADRWACTADTEPLLRADINGIGDDEWLFLELDSSVLSGDLPFHGIVLRGAPGEKTIAGPFGIVAREQDERQNRLTGWSSNVLVMRPAEALAP